MNAWVVVSLVSVVATSSVFLLTVLEPSSADPLKSVLHQLGTCAIFALVATLSVSTIARLHGRPGVIIWRRPLGLSAFYFATLHVLAYVFYQEGSPDFILEDVFERQFVFAGFVAWVLLVPLALTSTRSARRRMGVNWIRLHRAVYVIAALAILHQALAQKTPHFLAIVCAVFLVMLLLERLRAYWLKSDRLGRR